MAASFLDVFRTLASFAPPRTSFVDAPWDSYTDWAMGQGLAPLAAYNLEYRLGGAGAPQWVRDRLLSLYQGTLNDTVMKLVNFKRAVGALEGRQVVLLGAASWAEALYPHVAFRPVESLQLLVPPSDVAGFAGFLREAELKAVPSRAGEQGAAQVLSDGRTEVFLYGGLLGDASLDAALFERSLALKVFGPSMRRLELEDAILTLCLEHARSGYSFPLISLVDLRELLLGAPDLGGPYSHAPRFDVLLERARAWRLQRALFASARAVEVLFPDAAPAARNAQPPLRAATRALLERAVVRPLTTLGKMTAVRGADRLRRLLTGGRLGR